MTALLVIAIALLGMIAGASVSSLGWYRIEERTRDLVHDELVIMRGLRLIAIVSFVLLVAAMAWAVRL